MTFVETWSKAIHRLDARITRVLVALASHVSQHPFYYIIGCILTSFAFSIGFTQINVENDIEVLWIPQDSYTAKNLRYISDESGLLPQPRNTLFVVHADGQEMLSIEGIERMFTVYETIRDVRVGSITRDTVCQRGQDGHCIDSSILEVWNHNRTLFDTTIQTQRDLVNAVSIDTFEDGNTLIRANLMGQPQVNADNKIVSTTAFLGNILGDPDKVDDALEWERAVLHKILSLREVWNSSGPYRIEILTDRSFNDELESVISGDIPLMVMTYIIMGVYTCLVMGKRHRVKSHAMLGFGALMTVVFSSIAGYGLSLFLQVPFTSLTQVLPFILVGIGLDDAFILTASFDRTEHTKTTQERVKDMMSEVGLSITVTSLTDVIAFLLGSLTIIPAIRYFCIYAALCILFDYLYQITLFIGLLVYDQHRVNAHRYDCFCCFKANPAKTSKTNRQYEPETLTHALMRHYTAFLMKRAVKLFVIAAFTTLLGLGVYGALGVKQGFNPRMITPKDSYIDGFLDTMDNLFPERTLRVHAYFTRLDITTLESQKGVDQYMNELLALDFVKGPVVSWLAAFKAYYLQALGTDHPGITDDRYLTDKHEFYSQLRIFLGMDEFQPFNNDIVWGSNGEITTSRVSYSVFLNEDAVDQKNALLALNDVMIRQPLNQGREANGDWKLFSFEFNMMYWNTYTIIVGELIQNMALGLVAITFICLALFPHPVSFIFVVVCVGAIDVELMAWVRVMDLRINSITVVNLVMAIGLVVDFCTHVVAAFLEAKGETREDRVITSMRDTGTSVFIGGCSTLLGVMPLVLSTSTIFQSFFEMFIAIIVLGLSHGLIFLPVVLSLIGPLPKKSIEYEPPKQHDDAVVPEEIEMEMAT